MLSGVEWRDSTPWKAQSAFPPEPNFDRVSKTQEPLRENSRRKRVPENFAAGAAVDGGAEEISGGAGLHPQEASRELAPRSQGSYFYGLQKRKEKKNLGRMFPVFVATAW